MPPIEPAAPAAWAMFALIECAVALKVADSVAASAAEAPKSFALADVTKPAFEVPVP